MFNTRSELEQLVAVAETSRIVAAAERLEMTQPALTRAVAKLERRAGAPFFERLPTEIGRELVYIKTEDHYVGVHTTAGSARVLVRFADAVDELGDLGMQVHRCYWVAHGQMAELLTRGHRTSLRLTDDREVPVSRRYLPDVKAVLEVEQAAVGV